MAFFEKFGEKLTNAGKDVAKKTKELADVTKLNMQIGNEEDNIKSKYLEIGKLYYELFSSSPDEKFTELCSSIAESENKINTYKDQIQEIKGVKKCSKCGAEIASSAVFCSICGNKTAEPDKASESSEVVENSECVQNNEAVESTEIIANNEVSENSEDTEVSDIINSTTSVCTTCNKTVTDSSMFCPNCGNKVK